MIVRSRTRILVGTRHRSIPKIIIAVGCVWLVSACGSDAVSTPTGIPTASSRPLPDPATQTPIKHLVVIYDENVSFDHYFGTYPDAANTDGVKFAAKPDTPTPTNLLQGDLLTRNPNEFGPIRLTPSEAVTCDQNHSYGPEQEAADGGRNDKAVQFTSGDSCGIGGAFSTTGLAMGHYDGNTVTALWAYAQHYAMNDNSFGSTFGPSTPGALNLVAGQTHGMTAVDPHTGSVLPTSQFISSMNARHVGTVTGDIDPAFDDCAGNNHASPVGLGAMAGKNIGDLLNSSSITWGWFQGGFAPTTPYRAADGTSAKCDSRHNNVDQASSEDYVPHHNPFAYYKSTSNPHHLPPSSPSAIGQTDQANHNYDLSQFSTALTNGVLPSVSFLKPAAYQNAHAANSDPLDEQHFLVKEINAIESSKFWSSTAIVIAYDDSDGWYDQKSSPVLNGSNDQHMANSLIGDQPMCVTAAADAAIGMSGGYADRCGPGPRLPLLVISPFAKSNYVDGTPTEQASILAFIEDNWKTGRLGDGSFDARAGTLQNMFDFRATRGERVLLKSNGTVASVSSLPIGTSAN
jgi:phospholipase C